MTTLSATGLPLRHYYADRYVCLTDHRFAHPVNQPSCDCMRRRRPALPFRVVGGVLGIASWFVWLGSMGVVTALQRADERLRLGERRKEERLERR